MGILKGLTAGQKWVVVSIGLTLALAMGNLGRAIVALRYASSVGSISMTAPLGYFAAMGAFWGVVFTVCSVGLSGFRVWSRWCTLGAATLYQVNVWVNRLLFDASDYARRGSPRDLVLTAVILLIFWGSLNLPVVKRALGRPEEQQREWLDKGSKRQ